MSFKWQFVLKMASVDAFDVFCSLKLIKSAHILPFAFEGITPPLSVTHLKRF